MSSSVRVGDLIIVKISDLPGVSLSDSMGNMFTMLEMDRASSTYYNLIYYATASSSGPDTLTIRGDGNYPSIMATELQGLHRYQASRRPTGTRASHRSAHSRQHQVPSSWRSLSHWDLLYPSPLVLATRWRLSTPFPTPANMGR